MKMDNNELKNVSIKNPMCYYFEDIINGEDFDSALLDTKSYENILIYDISYKSLIGTKSLRIIFDKANGFIRDYDGTKYVALFGLKKYDAIYDRIRYLTIMQKSKLIQMMICL